MAVLALVAPLLGWTGIAATDMTGNQGSDCRKVKGACDLTLRIDAGLRPYTIGESVPLKATLINQGKREQAVEERALFRYINHERLPAREGEFSVGGQVIGDGPPASTNEATMAVLAPGAFLSRTVDVAPLLAGVMTEPGTYRIWLEYCYSGPKTFKGVSAHRGCIRSNEIVLNMVPR